jgi:tetratricopeptide (TPR) repeat protein
VENYDKALADYTRASRLDPKNLEGHLGQGTIYWRKGLAEKALEEFKAALKLDSKDENALAWMAFFLASCSEAKFRDGKKALEFATQACEKTNWDENANFEALAAAHAELGDFDEAVKWQNKALSVSWFTDKALERAKQRLKLYQEKKPYREGIPPPGGQRE